MIDSKGRLECPKCGSTHWTITAEFKVGYTVPILIQDGYLVRYVPNPDWEPKCAICGGPRPTFEQLMEFQRNQRRR